MLLYGPAEGTTLMPYVSMRTLRSSRLPCVSMRTLKGSPPLAIGHVKVYCPDIEYTFLYGGFRNKLDSAVYLLNARTLRWEVDNTHAKLYRFGHLVVYIGNGNVLVYGGIPLQVFGRELNPHPLYDLEMLVYSIPNRTWTGAPKERMVNAPLGRIKHACCISNDCQTIYISGGLVNNQIQSGIYSYNMNTGIWTGPVLFIARFNHIITVHDEILYLLGGMGVNNRPVSQFICSLDLNTYSVIILNRIPKRNNCPQSFKIITSFTTCLSVPTVMLSVYILSDQSTKKEYIKVVAIDVPKNSHRTILTTSDYINSIKSSGVNVDISIYQFFFGIVAEGRLCLFGTKNRGPSPRLSTILQVDLSKMGLGLSHNDESLVADLRQMFLTEEGTDFEIFAYKDDQTKESYVNSTSSKLLDDETFVKDNLVAIRVHQNLLLARWPHFRRMIESGMSEKQSGRLLIPELVTPVRGLLFYLYTGTVEFSHLGGLSAADLSSVLTLANIYQLPRLRTEILAIFERIFPHKRFLSIANDQTVEMVLNLWKNAHFLGETALVECVENLIRNNWVTVATAPSFKTLHRDILLQLCLNCFSIDTGNSIDQSPFTKSFENLLSQVLNNPKDSNNF